MKQVNKVVRALGLAALICVMLTTVAYAAGDGAVWLSEAAAADGMSALIVTDTTVTDGLVTLTYDSAVLTYQNLEVAEEYVAMYSVNPDQQQGVVRISWVAPHAYEADGSGIELISVSFSGTAEEGSIVLSGTVHDAQGNEIVIGDVDTTELEASAAVAKELNEGDYTEESYADLTKALAAAEAVLADPTVSQSEVDKAAADLRAAIEALEKRQDEPETEPETDPEETDEGNPADPAKVDGPDTGDHNMIILPAVLALISAAAAVELIILKNRRSAK